MWLGGANVGIYSEQSDQSGSIAPADQSVASWKLLVEEAGRNIANIQGSPEEAQNKVDSLCSTEQIGWDHPMPQH